jgi:hypothetical protein
MLYWSMQFVSALADANRRHVALQSSMTSLAVVLAFGAPIAYAATLVIGVPAYYFGNGKHPRLVTTLLSGALTGVGTALLLHRFLTGDLFSIPLTPAHGAALGAATGAVFWYCVDEPTSN